MTYINFSNIIPPIGIIYVDDDYLILIKEQIENMSLDLFNLIKSKLEDNRWEKYKFITEIEKNNLIHDCILFLYYLNKHNNLKINYVNDGDLNYLQKMKNKINVSVNKKSNVFQKRNVNKINSDKSVKSVKRNKNIIKLDI